MLSASHCPGAETFWSNLNRIKALLLICMLVVKLVSLVSLVDLLGCSNLEFVVQSLSLSDSATPWTAACQASLSFTVSQSLLKLMSVESVMPPNISSSVVPFSFCLQSFPASGSFLKNWLFASGSQSIGASSASVLLMSSQN